MPLTALYGDLPENSMVGNVAYVYERLAADIRNKTQTAPSFADAVALQKLLATIEQSAENKASERLQLLEVPYVIAGRLGYGYNKPAFGYKLALSQVESLRASKNQALSPTSYEFFPR